MVVRFGGSSTSLNRTGSTSSLNTGAMSRQRTVSTGDEATSPYSPGATLYGHSPSNLDGAMNFVAPDLEEETLMDKEHNDTVSKLNFILALVECIIEAAQTRSSPITHSMTVTEKGFKLDHGGAFLTEQQRRLEQLVLYVRALQLLTSSIQLAKEEVHAHRLQPTNTVKMILKDMNNYYHQCLVVCKNLHSKGPGTTDDSFDTHAATITADKLIYTYAIDMCQTAALDELFGNPQDCFHRYRNAQIMLHSLAQATQSEEDRALLNKYREAVEKRLTILQGQIHNAAAMTN